MEWFKSIFIIQVTNKVFVVVFTNRNLLDTNTFSISTSPQNIFLSISILLNVKSSLTIFIYKSQILMFYNVMLFLVQSAFVISFIASFTAIKLIIQQQSKPLMFKMAIRFLAIINKS